MLVTLEFRLRRFEECHGLARDHMHQRAALQGWEHIGIDAFLELRLGQDDAAARAAQGLVRGRGDEIGMRHRVGVNPSRDQAGIMRHIDHKIRANLLGNLGHARPVEAQCIGRSAAYQQLRLAFERDAFHLVVVNFFLIVQTVRHNVE